MSEQGQSPYSTLPSRAFWRSGVADRGALDPGDLYEPRFRIKRNMRIVTAGSCFAQHVGRALRGAGLNVVDTEPLPSRIPDEVAWRYGYRLYSARYGNIYTARQLLQLFREAKGEFSPAEPVWTRDGRYFDAQRTGVEPEGLDSAELVLEHRALHLASVRKAFSSADLFVFTFGLTEGWVHTPSETVFPTAPGVIAGSYDPDVHSFKNYDCLEVLDDFERFRTELRRINDRVRFLVTVSPVPLTATASGEHVEVATCYSKSALRAVCGILQSRHEDVDYFPSFELITSTNNRGIYYEANKRNVSAAGVQAAMGMFMGAHRLNAKKGKQGKGRNETVVRPGRKQEEAVCEEALLEAFAQ